MYMLWKWERIWYNRTIAHFRLLLVFKAVLLSLFGDLLFCWWCRSASFISLRPSVQVESQDPQPWDHPALTENGGLSQNAWSLPDGVFVTKNRGEIWEGILFGLEVWKKSWVMLLGEPSLSLFLWLIAMQTPDEHLWYKCISAWAAFSVWPGTSYIKWQSVWLHTPVLASTL